MLVKSVVPMVGEKLIVKLDTPAFKKVFLFLCFFDLEKKTNKLLQTQLPTLINVLAKFYDRLTAENAKLNATVLFNIDNLVDSSCELAQVDLYVNENSENSFVTILNFHSELIVIFDGLVDKIKKWRTLKSLVIPEFRTITVVQQATPNSNELEFDSTVLSDSLQTTTTSTSSSMEQYDHVAVGGTFDHLHAGHKLLLSASVAVAKQKLTIGLTGFY